MTARGETAAAPEDLRAGFDAFIAAARRLERSYEELKARAAAVDSKLQDTNRALERALCEREAIFAALPLGLVAVRPGALPQVCNREGERLAAALARAGAAAATVPAGEVAIDGGAVRVRRVDLPGDTGELVLLEDRSRVVELEREVHRLDRLAGLSELALGIAHEIKNPLNGVMGFAALLERSAIDAVQKRYAARIGDGLRQVDAIVKALLGFVRPERGTAATAPLAAIVAEAAAAAGLPAARVELTGCGTVSADADALARVLANLFANAREAAGAAVAVRVQAAVIGERLELTVADDGPGVPAELGARVLEPFVTSKERGTGLGLPLCVRVLGYLGGELALLNAGEPGARFRVRLPLPAAAPVLAEVAS